MDVDIVQTTPSVKHLIQMIFFGTTLRLVTL